MAKIFMSYKHNVDPDDRLANYFTKYLTEQGHQVFIAKQMLPGTDWPTAVKQEIEQADFLIVLLSEHSVGSEMVIQEVSIAHSHKKQHGSPIILPIRVSYTISYDQMSYDLGAKLARIQDITWIKDGDEIEIRNRLSLVITQPIEEDTPGDQSEKTNVAAGDGNAIQLHTKIASPLPAFDPQWLMELDTPGGAVHLDSRFYIERTIDNQIKSQLLRKGVTLAIKGSRQIGKTSLLARLSQHAIDNSYPLLYIDFQEIDDDRFQNLEILLRYLADRIAKKQQTNTSPDYYWQKYEQLGAKDRVTNFLSQEVLKYLTNPLVFIMDEVDRLFDFDQLRNDFFALIRSWHNKRAIPDYQAWKKLNIVLTYSTEASAFITNRNQSPFNVATHFNLTNFDRSQLETLNWQHGSPLKTSQEIESIMELLQGHPFLVRTALYVLTIQKLTVDELIQQAYDQDGPFGDHLQHYLFDFFDRDPEMRQAMKSVIQNHTCPSNLLFYRLRSGGLVVGSSRTNVLPRCGLYARFFQQHL